MLKVFDAVVDSTEPNLVRRMRLIIGICRFVINFRIPVNKYDVVIRTVADQEGNIVRFYVFKFL